MLWSTLYPCMSILSHEGEDVQLLKRIPSQGEQCFHPCVVSILFIGRDYLWGLVEKSIYRTFLYPSV